jgi:hypothetical protein
MTVSLNINSDPSIARERVYQDYVKYYWLNFQNWQRNWQHILRKNLAYFPMSSRITLNSNCFDVIRSGVSTKGQVVSIGNSIDPTNFKEIGTKNYWINNSVNIWNNLTVQLQLYN